VLVYQKGAWILHMLRILMLDLRTMNEDRFTGMLQEFYRTYNGGRVSTADFQRMVERHMGAPMDWFFKQWVYGTDLPTYRVAYKTEPAGNGQYRVKLRVEQQDVSDDFQMSVPVALDLGERRTARVRVTVKGPSSELELPLLAAEPKGLRFADLEAVLGEVKMVGW
jgi:aminopeptidase N